MEEIFSGIKNIYLIGIGGVGMSGLALLLRDKGFIVKGSDIKENANVKMLRNKGIEVFIGHRRENISSDIQLLGYSSAIDKDNPEIREAEKRGIPILKRSQILKFISIGKKTIAVAGSHGKTTVTSLLSYLLTSLGYHPTVFVGGLPLNYSSGAWWGGDYFVIETDESDGSFLEFDPWVSIITNIDYEHLDYYHNIENLQRSMLRFASQTTEKVLGCGDDAYVRKIISDTDGLSYGFGKENKLKGKNLFFDGKFSYFDVFIEDDFFLNVKIPLLGEHNVLNTLGVLSFFFYIGENLEKVAQLLKDFKGVKRRFQIKEKIEEVTFVDDYAHHPTEIEMVLKAAKQLNPKRLFVIFEPHRFSRIKLLYEKFSNSFSHADVLVVTDIYSAHEENIGGIDGKFIFEKIKNKFPKFSMYIPRERVAKIVPYYIKKGDLVIGLGAGEINILMEEIIDEFRKNRVKA
jgi:UDP-N-acetylmuramate--alanine ligase